MLYQRYYHLLNNSSGVEPHWSRLNAFAEVKPTSILFFQKLKKRIEKATDIQNTDGEADYAKFFSVQEHQKVHRMCQYCREKQQQHWRV
jgi:hypothetical protein